MIARKKMIRRGTINLGGIKKGFLTMIVSGIVLAVNAQQDPYLTHYMFNKLQYNPATAGEKDKICVAGIFHTQWTGLDDNTFEYWKDQSQGSVKSGVGPKTYGIQGSAPVADLTDRIKLGLGAAIVQDNLGYETILKARAAVSGTYTMNNGSSIALGFDIGILQKGLDGSNFFFHDQGDLNIPQGNQNTSKFNVSAGLYYMNPVLNDLYVGLSSTNINEQDFDITNNVSLKSARHYYLVTGMTLNNFIGNPNLKLHPSLLVKSENITQFTVSGLAEYADTYWGGLAYRSTVDALSVMLGYNVNQDLRIGYSYDITLSNLGRFSNGSHEIQVNYCMMPLAKPAAKKLNELTPRFLNKNPNID